MANITTAELRQAVAEKLRKAAADMDLDADTAAKIDDGIDTWTAFYREQGLIWWADDAIPMAAKGPMTNIISALIAADMGKAGQGYESGLNLGLEQIAMIRSSADTPTLAVCFF